MKLTSVELHPEGSSDIGILSFRDPSSTNKYNVKGITGLDADEIISKYYGMPDGSTKLFNLSLMKREIAIQIGLNPNFSNNESYSNLRDSIYKMIASSRTGKIDLYFKNNNVIVATIKGHIIKIESPLFEKTQEIQITIKCDDPMFKAPSITYVSTAGLNPANIVIKDDKSTAPHGIVFNMNIVSTFSNFIVSDPDFSWHMEIIPVGGFRAGDILVLSTEYNNKYVYILRGGNTILLSDAITPGSIWPIIFPGSNSFSFAYPNGFIFTLISYYSTYWGV